jgi:AcrR family transcriptional regulator
VGRKSLANERRAQIIEGLSRCISKHGLKRASIKRIAEEAGVLPSILHHYFKDRDEIIDELVRQVVDDLADRCAAQLRVHRNSKTRFDKGVEFLFGPPLLSAENIAFFNECWAEANRKPRVRASFTRLYRRFREVVLELLTETGKSRGLSPADANDLASLIIAIHDGVEQQWTFDPGSVSLKRMARLTKQIVDLYVKHKGQVG